MTSSENLLLALIESQRLPRRTRDIATSLLLLSAPPEHTRLWGQLGRGIREGTLAADARLLRGMYPSLPRRLKIQLAASFAASALEAKTFKLLFEDALRKCRPDRQERVLLARSLSRFFDLHPELSARGLGASIRLLLHSRAEEERAHALLVVDRLERLREDELQIILADARSRSRALSTNAWLALSLLARKNGALNPSVIVALRRLAEARLAKSSEPARVNIRQFSRLTRRSALR